jgi:hypothetical protein
LIEKRLLIVAGAFQSLRDSLLSGALAGSPPGIPHLYPHPHTQYPNGVRLDAYARINNGRALALDFLREYEPYDVVTSEEKYAHELFCREATALGYQVSISRLEIQSFRHRWEGRRTDTLKFVRPWLSRAYFLDGNRPPAEIVARLRQHPSVALIREPVFVERLYLGRTAVPALPA